VTVMTSKTDAARTVDSAEAKPSSVAVRWALTAMSSVIGVAIGAVIGLIVGVLTGLIPFSC
jgi:hypothetical protein